MPSQQLCPVKCHPESLCFDWRASACLLDRKAFSVTSLSHRLCPRATAQKVNLQRAATPPPTHPPLQGHQLGQVAPQSTTIIPCLHLESSLFAQRRHPGDSHLHVGVIINGLYSFQVCSACSLFPCVHSKHQFDVSPPYFHQHFVCVPWTQCRTKTAFIRDSTKAGIVKMWPCLAPSWASVWSLVAVAY